MGIVVSLDSYRAGHRPEGERASEVNRLERAVARLDPAVRRFEDGVTPTIERELRAIARAVTAGRHRDAADRAERLLGLLSHPALSS